MVYIYLYCKGRLGNLLVKVFARLVVDPSSIPHSLRRFNGSFIAKKKLLIHVN